MKVKIRGGYPPTVNDPVFVERVSSAAGIIVGEENVIRIARPSMGTEDMSLYLQQVPGAYFALGTGNPARGIVYPHYNPRFDLDEGVQKPARRSWPSLPSTISLMMTGKPWAPSCPRCKEPRS